MAKDSRMISFLNDLEEKGNLRAVVDFVKNSKEQELEICFRGNSKPESITIYKNNHMVWNIMKSGDNSYVIDISLNHARYTSDWKKQVTDMIKVNNEFAGKTCPVIKKTNDNYCYVGYFKSNPLNKVNNTFLKETYKVIDSLFGDYFDGQKNIDVFKKEKLAASYVPKNKKVYEEKIKQQELYTKILNGINSEYLAYDLEFVQPELKEGSNQPDMFAIKKLADNKFKIVLVEVKSTESACTGKSGLVNHLNGMIEYIKVNNYMNSRKMDAINIVNAFRKLGLRGTGNDFEILDKGFTIDMFEGIEILFILTGEKEKGAIDYFERIKKAKSKTYKSFQAVCKNSKDYDICLKKYTDNGCFEDLIL